MCRNPLALSCFAPLDLHPLDLHRGIAPGPHQGPLSGPLDPMPWSALSPKRSLAICIRISGFQIFGNYAAPLGKKILDTPLFWYQNLHYVWKQVGGWGCGSEQALLTQFKTESESVIISKEKLWLSDFSFRLWNKYFKLKIRYLTCIYPRIHLVLLSCHLRLQVGYVILFQQHRHDELMSYCSQLVPGLLSEKCKKSTNVKFKEGWHEWHLKRLTV